MLSRRQLLSLAPAALAAQGHPEYNYDEAKVEPYRLPEVLTVRDERAWNRQRRPELLRLFEANVYGRTPRNRLSPAMELLSPDAPVFDGKATRRQVRIWFSEDRKEDKKGPKMDLLLYVPTGVKKPVPAFLGLNFTGNQAVHEDPGIHLGQIWAINYLTTHHRIANLDSWNRQHFKKQSYTSLIRRTAIAILSRVGGRTA